jgi:hypothetical protein
MELEFSQNFPNMVRPLFFEFLKLLEEETYRLEQRYERYEELQCKKKVIRDGIKATFWAGVTCLMLKYVYNNWNNDNLLEYQEYQKAYPKISITFSRMIGMNETVETTWIKAPNYFQIGIAKNNMLPLLKKTEGQTVVLVSIALIALIPTYFSITNLPTQPILQPNGLHSCIN